MIDSIYVCLVLNFLHWEIVKDKDTVIKIAARIFGKEAIREAIEV